MPRERLFEDTDEEAERVLIELTRATPVWKKFKQIADCAKLARRFALGGLRLRYPASTEQDLQRRLPALFLDRETVIEVYGWDPKVEGY